MRHFYKYLTASFFLSLFFILPLPVYAQLMINKGKIIETVNPDTPIMGTILVHNTKDRPINVEAYMEDFEYIPPFNGKKRFSPAGTTEKSISQYINFAPQTFTLPPFGRQEIRYTIRLPKDAKGGYYGVMFFEENRADQLKATGVRIVTRVGCLIFVETTGSSHAAEVQDITLSNGRFSGKFVNSGETILMPKGIFYILGDNGMVADRGEIKKVYLPPGKEVKFQADFSKDLAAGHYTIVLTFELDNRNPIVKEISFKKDPSGVTLLEVRD